MFVTIDPYYDVSFFNSCKEALKNNNVPFKLFISTLAPYNWYFKISTAPVMINFDVLSQSHERFLVQTVNPIYFNDEMRYFRRDSDKGKFVQKFILNDAFEDVKDSEFFIFDIKQSKTDLEMLSKLIPHKIWYLGRYYQKKYKLALIKSDEITNVLIPKTQILFKRTLDMPVEKFEADFNYKVFLLKDRLFKNSRTPFFEAGKYILPEKLPSDYDKFIKL